MNIKSELSRYQIVFLLITIISLFSLLVNPSLIAAQAPEDTVTTETNSNPEGVVNCFDYYHFGSVQVSLGRLPQTIQPGEVAAFVGTVNNTNKYPIINTAVYAKVFRAQTDEELRHRNGDFLVDEFFVARNLNIDAEGTHDIAFSWTAPKALVAGAYNIAFYVVSADRFNLGGLSFTDDVIGTREFFTVETAKDTSLPIEWNKNAVQVNKKNYAFAQPIPKFAKEEQVVVSAPITNPTNTTQVVAVHWDAYNWDAQNSQNKITESDVSVTLKPYETRTISYVVPDPIGPVTYVVGTVTAYGGQSIINVRFAHLEFAQPRLNFPALTTFPIKAGETFEIFSCLHNAALESVEGGTLRLALLDATGAELAVAQYRGDITSRMMGYRETFIATQDITYARLIATIGQQNAVIDTVELTYDCKEINSEKCVIADTISDSTEQNSSINKNILYMLSIIGLLIGIGMMIYSRRMGKTPTIPVLAFLLVLLGGAFLAPSVHAESVTWTNSSPYTTPTVLVAGGLINSQLSLSDAFVTVQYNAQSNVATLPSSPTSVSQGQHILISVPYADTDISWFGTGGYTDSPYGRWSGGWANKCANSNYVESAPTSEIFGQVHITRAVPTITASGMSCTGSGPFDCTVTSSSGAVSATVNFPSTSGELRLEAWSYDEAMTPAPLGGVAMSAEKNKFFSFIQNAFHQIFPFVYAALARPAESFCVVGTPTAVAVAARSITYNYTVTAPPAICAWEEGEWFYNEPDGSCDGMVGSGKPNAGSTCTSANNGVVSTWAGCKGDSLVEVDFTCSCGGGGSGPALISSAALDCTIALNASTCTTNVSWTISNPVSPSIKQFGTQFSTLASSAGVSRTMLYGVPANNSITFTDNGVTLGSITPAGVCAVNTAWDGTKCATTATPAPTVTTNPASTITSTGATLNGLVNPNGADATSFFRIGTSNVACTSLPTRVPNLGGNVLTGSSAQAYLQVTTGLAANTTYYYCAIASNTTAITRGSVVSFTTANPAPINEPIGNFDSATCIIAAGWACDKDDGNYAIAVHFYDGPGFTTFLGATTANVSREAAVGTACGGNSLHGFSFTLPTSVVTGTNHTIYAYGINIAPTGSANSEILSSKVINCAIPLPDLVAANTGPAANASYTTAQSIPFTGTVTNQSAANMLEGGWHGLEIDIGRNGYTQVNPDIFGQDTYYDRPLLGAFAANQSKALSWTIPAGGLPVGNHSYRWNVDAAGGHTESNETNNRSAWINFSVTAPIVYSCQGSNPLYSNSCGSVMPPSNLTKVLVPSCTATNLCQFICNAGYTLSSGSCVPITYTCAAPPINATLYPALANVTPTSNLTTIYSSTDTSRACEFNCNSSTPFWSGSACLALPTLTASPLVVNQGSVTIISWDTNNGAESLCTIQGGAYAGAVNLSTLPANGDGETGSFTPTINANTTYTLTCPSGTATVTVEITPTGFET